MANCAHTSFDPDDELIRESEFKALFGGVCGFTIYRWRKADPDFPKPDYVRTSRSGKQQPPLLLEAQGTGLSLPQAGGCGRVTDQINRAEAERLLAVVRQLPYQKMSALYSKMTDALYDGAKAA
jgi:hypothetical protein